MSYTEAVNGINIVDAKPMEDPQGQILNGENNVFDFTVSATTSGDTINYKITATKEQGSTIDDNQIKVYLTSANDEIVEKEATLMSGLEKTGAADASGAPTGQYVLKQGTISASETTNYRLRMWVNSGYEDATPETPESYKIRVNVYGKAA